MVRIREGIEEFDPGRGETDGDDAVGYIDKRVKTLSWTITHSQLMLNGYQK